MKANSRARDAAGAGQLDSCDALFAASEAGNKREGARWLMRALMTYPEGLGQRPFWGCLRKLTTNGTVSNHE
jgi:hypothetical protein